MNGLPDALLFALEVRDRGVLELEPILLISLQSQSLWPETITSYYSVSVGILILKQLF